jgi:hypothetical protein
MRSLYAFTMQVPFLIRFSILFMSVGQGLELSKHFFNKLVYIYYLRFHSTLPLSMRDSSLIQKPYATNRSTSAYIRLRNPLKTRSSNSPALERLLA